MRAGTSWLYESLKGQPNIWCPPVKEMRLLLAIQELGPLTCAERFGPAGSSNGTPSDQLNWWRDVTWLPYLNAMTEQVAVWRQAGIGTEAALELDFWFRYLGQPLTLDLYDQISRLAPTRRLLDVSPDYVNLTSNTLRSFSSRFPHTKLIVMLRSPADRLRSQIRMDIASGVSLDDDFDSAYTTAYLESPYSLSQINVQRHVERIMEFFPAEDIMICFFDDLRDRSAELSKKIAAFCETFIANPISHSVNSHPEVDIPEWLEEYIKMATHDATSDLAMLVGGHAVSWHHGNSPQDNLLSGTLSELRAL